MPVFQAKPELLGFLLLMLCAGCVVTTYEGPGEPARVASAPPPPSRGKPSPSEPIATSPQRAPEGEARAATDGGAEASVQASHILVAYQGAMRARPTILRNKEEARKRAEEALAKAKGGEDFAKLAGEYSDEPGAAERGGSIGRFPRSAVVREFADAAFGLKPGEISGIVETPFGYHIIMRTE
ncbi:MAG TPA: peptidylprolyl isomerase [Polyangiaceae bacterium]|nr:peptidylprolyl isomerase [Polyangiaceae bacterium]